MGRSGLRLGGRLLLRDPAPGETGMSIVIFLAGVAVGAVGMLALIVWLVTRP